MFEVISVSLILLDGEDRSSESDDPMKSMKRSMKDSRCPGVGGTKRNG